MLGETTQRQVSVCRTEHTRSWQVVLHMLQCRTGKEALPAWLGLQFAAAPFLSWDSRDRSRDVPADFFLLGLRPSYAKIAGTSQLR